MPHAIIRGKSGRRREVDFEGCALRVEVHAGDETVEIFVEAEPTNCQNNDDGSP